jgi:hypothetical protein
MERSKVKRSGSRRYQQK